MSCKHFAIPIYIFVRGVGFVAKTPKLVSVDATTLVEADVENVKVCFKAAKLNDGKQSMKWSF